MKGLKVFFFSTNAKDMSLIKRLFDFPVHLTRIYTYRMHLSSLHSIHNRKQHSVTDDDKWRPFVELSCAEQLKN